VVPFEDEIYLFEMDTAMLKDIIEAEISYWRGDLPISGVKIFFDPEYAAGGKVSKIEFSSNRPIIRVASSEYLILQKKLSTWNGVYNIRPTQETIYETIVKHLTKQPEIAFGGEARYVVTKAETKKVGKVNINKADERELVSLPMIGPALAKRIIEYRSKNGPFRNLSDLKKVKGIGEKQINKIKVLIEF